MSKVTIENLGELNFSDVTELISYMDNLFSAKEGVSPEKQLEINLTLNALAKALKGLLEDYFKCDDAEIKSKVKSGLKSDFGKSLTVNGIKYTYSKQAVESVSIDRTWLKANGYKSHEDFFKATNTPYIKQDLEYRFDKKYYEEHPTNDPYIKVDVSDKIFIQEEDAMKGGK